MKILTCAKECGAWQYLKKARQSRTMVLVIVWLALFLDFTLLTVVVPIIPSFLYNQHMAEMNNSAALKHPQALPSTAFPDSAYSTDGQFMTQNTTRTEGFEWRNTTEAPIVGLKTTAASVNCSKNDTFLSDENIRVGLLFASKAIVQLLVNPLVGPLTSRIGYDIPMFTGFVILFTSTIMYAYANTYTVLFIARALQGVGSSCSTVSGLGMLANQYTDDNERGKYMGIALGGVALGVLIGAPFGSVMYQFAGKSSPFLILAALVLVDGVLQLCILQPTMVVTECQKGASLLELLRDPYILVVAGSLCFANMAVAMLEQALPLWMLKTMCVPQLYLGLAFLPSTISYLLCTNIFGIVANKLGRWLCSLIGMVLLAISLITVPLATNIYYLIFPMVGTGISIGMIDSSLFPIMGYLVDIRHVSVYGSVFAISDVALCLGFAIGPSMGGIIVKAIGFPWLMFIIGVMNIAYAPLCIFLKNPPAKEEKMAILSQDNAVNANLYTAESDIQDFPMIEARNDSAHDKNLKLAELHDTMQHGNTDIKTDTNKESLSFKRQ
ncbi:chromaffin granule amine transporter [Scyliorhinus canicula]|uniref:chromaffin granule amine transporter n=1 Tax=Scyliorhinus canicula TaxID=7830 RepID=UPI0018F30810|nr:chromaffin granule amine transporter [Scyliorhinus canicula]